MPEMAPNGDGKFFILLIQTSPTCWVARSLILICLVHALSCLKRGVSIAWDVTAAVAVILFFVGNDTDGHSMPGTPKTEGKTKKPKKKVKKKKKKKVSSQKESKLAVCRRVE